MSTAPHSTTSIRQAAAADVPLLAALVRELADYEHRLDEVALEPAALEAALFGPRRLADAVIADVVPPAGDKVQPAGFALFWYTFSTFRGRPNLYIEDLFVRPEFRRLGAGRALVQHLARLAVERECGRLEWSVLTWNAPAIQFYHGLGARPVTDWAVYELSGAALQRLADERGS
jgi:GNAT superfamily N-acetyltransferase